MTVIKMSGESMTARTQGWGARIVTASAARG
jgi:hypothetical protein